MKTHEWSPNFRSKALGLCQGGRHSLRNITNIINISKSTIYDIKKRDTAATKQRSGHAKKLTDRDKRHLEMYTRTNRTTGRVSLSYLNSILPKKTHENTIRKALNELAYNHRIARRCPFFNTRDGKRRLLFAKKVCSLDSRGLDVSAIF